MSASAEWDKDPPEGICLADWQADVRVARMCDQNLSELDFEVLSGLESPHHDAILESPCSSPAY